MKKNYYRNIFNKPIKGIILMGPPGSGKGTFNKMISK